VLQRRSCAGQGHKCVNLHQFGVRTLLCRLPTSKQGAAVVKQAACLTHGVRTSDEESTPLSNSAC
jgi:hypothetical protein